MNFKNTIAPLLCLLFVSFVSCKEKTHCYNCVTTKYVNSTKTEERTKRICDMTEQEISDYQRDSTITTVNGPVERHVFVTTCTR